MHTPSSYMKDIPLIFVHKDNSSYLEPVLTHNYNFNREADIYLLGDGSNINSPFVKHIMMEQYSTTAIEFEKIYKHMSSNSYEFELGCFQRWFIINEFVKERGIEHFVCLDSDVLLFCNVSEVFSHFVSYDFTVSQQHSPHITLFSRESLDRFCNYLRDLYTKPDYINRFKLSYQEFKDENRQGGICDMFAFSLYPKDISDNIKELSDLSGDFFFDNNMNEEDELEMENGLKKIYWKNGLPYAKTLHSGLDIRLYGMHFQGGAKAKVSKYVLNKNLKRPGIISSLKELFTK